MQKFKTTLNFILPMVFILFFSCYFDMFKVIAVCMIGIFAKEGYDTFRFGEKYLKNAMFDLLVRLLGCLLSIIILMIQNIIT